MRLLIALLMVITMTACGGGVAQVIDPPTQYDRGGWYDMTNGEAWQIVEDGGDCLLYSPHPDHPATMVDRGELVFNVNDFTMSWHSVDPGGPYAVAGQVTAAGMRVWFVSDPDNVTTGTRGSPTG